jgi:putative zinc finger/helix-turn-helix YgiT family protein
VDYAAKLEHDGRLYEVLVKGLEVLRCENCGAQMLPDAAYQRLTDALREKAGLLTPAQITQKRQELGLSQKELASHLGVAPETVCRWESGGQVQQRVMNDFLQAFFDLPELRAYLRRRRSAAPAVPPAVTAPPPANAQRP